MVPGLRTGKMFICGACGACGETAGLSIDSYLIERIEEGGWRVIQKFANAADIPIADFVSFRDAEEWVRWKQGIPRSILISERSSTRNDEGYSSAASPAMRPR
jgi:hypothetical protein